MRYFITILSTLFVFTSNVYATLCAMKPDSYVDPNFNSAYKTDDTDFSFFWTISSPNYGEIHGISACNSTSGSAGVVYPQYEFGHQGNGVNCWGQIQSPARSSWVYVHAYSSVSECAMQCAQNVSNMLAFAMGPRISVFNSLETGDCPTGYMSVSDTSWCDTHDCFMSSIQCSAGTYLPAGASVCAICPANYYCPGGTYAFNASNDSGKTACVAGTYSAPASDSASQCGSRLRVGNWYVPLRTTKLTVPSLHIRMTDGTMFYGDLFPV